MKKRRAVLLLVLVFGLGVLCGVVGTRVVVRLAVRTALQQPDRVWTRFERRLAAELDLTPEQQLRAYEVLATARRALQEFRSETRPRYAAIVDQALTNLAPVLTPSQQEQLDRFRARRPFFLPRDAAGVAE